MIMSADSITAGIVFTNAIKKKIGGKKMSQVDIDQWIDMDSADFKRVGACSMVRKVVNIGIEAGIIRVDKAGYMWQGDNPVHAELDGKFVGLRYSAKALN